MRVAELEKEAKAGEALRAELEAKATAAAADMTKLQAANAAAPAARAPADRKRVFVWTRVALGGPRITISKTHRSHHVSRARAPSDLLPRPGQARGRRSGGR